MVCVTDSFNRADGALGTTDTGQTWLTLAGSPVVASNEASASGGTGFTYVAAVHGFADVDATLAVPVRSTPGQTVGFILRAKDANNFWGFEFYRSIVGGNPDYLYAYSVIGGVYTYYVGSALAGVTITPTYPTTMEVIADGRNFSVSVGTETFTFAAPVASFEFDGGFGVGAIRFGGMSRRTKHGLMIYRTGGAANSVDDYSGCPV